MHTGEFGTIKKSRIFGKINVHMSKNTTLTLPFEQSPKRISSSAGLETDMHATHTEMTFKTGSPPVECVNDRPAGTDDLREQPKHSCLNERHPRSVALQKLFDQVVSDLESYSDRLADLAIAFEELAKDTSKMAMNSKGPSDSQRQIADVSAALNAFGASVRNAIDETVTSGDFAKAHLFIEVLRDINAQLSAVECPSPSK